MEKLANIPQFETLQATANSAIGFPGGVFDGEVMVDNFGARSEQPLTRKYEGISERALEEKDSIEQAKLMEQAQDVNAKLIQKKREGKDRHIQKQGETLGRFMYGKDKEGNVPNIDEITDDALALKPPLWYGARELSKDHKKS